jgi:hypothetical protein
MGAFVRWLIGWPWCRHEWEIIRSGRITEGSRVTGTYYELQCKKCGDVKCRNL